MLKNQHLTELLQSGICQDLIELNFKSLDRDDPLEYLLYGLSPKERRNDGRLRGKWLKQLKHTYHGGWWCSGVDVLSGGDALWGHFKPDSPLWQPNSQKHRKYESPRKVSTEIFALRVSPTIAQAIADRSGIELPSSLKQPQGSDAVANFWGWVLATPEIPLIVTEGSKKAACLLSNGFAAIALPGIYSGYRQPKDEAGNKTGLPYLIPQLAAFAVPGRKINFVFDNDSKPSTRQNVRTAILKTARLLMAKGAECSTVRWDKLPYQIKGVDDLIVAKGIKVFENCYRQSTSIGQYELEGLTKLGNLVNKVYNQQYLEGSEIDSDAQLIGLKSAKGTGKTYLLERLAANAHHNGQRTLVLTHRVQLAKALCHRLGIDHVDDYRRSDTKGSLGIGLCVDSLKQKSKARFDAEEWRGALLVLDEVEQVFWHLVSSNTCQQDRVEILQNFQTLLRTVVSSGGKIVISDADLSPMSITFIKQLVSAEIKTYIIENQYSPVAGKRKLYHYNSPASLIDKIDRALGQEQKIYLAVGAQKEKSTWSSINLETMFRLRRPNAKVLRIDAESISDSTHPAYNCIEFIDEILKEYDLVIASPTLETGVSIELRNHFDLVAGIYYGVQTVNTVSQSLARVRADVDRHIFVADRGLNFIGRGETNIRQLLRTQHEQAKANISCLIQSSLNSITIENIDTDYQQASLNYWAKMAVIVNSGMWKYKEFLFDKLEGEGYLIVDAGDPDMEKSKAIAQEMKEIKTMAYDLVLEEIASAEPLSEHEAKQYERKKQLTKVQRQQLRKFKLKKIYGLEVTPELVEKDDDFWYGKLRLHYYLTVGRKYLVRRDLKTFDSLAHTIAEATEEKKTVFKPDLTKKMLFARVRGLELLRIDQFLLSNQKITQSSLKEWFEFILMYRHQIKSLYGIQVTELSSPITILQSFLKQLDLKLDYLGRYGSRKDRERTYALLQPETEAKQQVFAHWLKRDEQFYDSLEACPAISINS